MDSVTDATNGTTTKTPRRNHLGRFAPPGVTRDLTGADAAFIRWYDDRENTERNRASSLGHGLDPLFLAACENMGIRRANDLRRALIHRMQRDGIAEFRFGSVVITPDDLPEIPLCTVSPEGVVTVVGDDAARRPQSLIPSQESAS
jgi:hypothetical protein